MSLPDRRRCVPLGIYGCGNLAILKGHLSCLLKWRIQNLIYLFLSVSGSSPGTHIFGGTRLYQKKKLFIFVWLRWVLVAAHGLFVAA